jgi:DDE superfamily endonuclease
MTVATPHRAPEEPAMPLSHLPPFLASAFAALAHWLDRRSAARLPLLLGGILFAHGRRTVTSWFRPAGIADDYRPAYTTVCAVGRKATSVALSTLHTVQPLLAGGRLTVAVDDTPTPRYGPDVEAAGIHHNPSKGPAGEKFVYGHVWVTLAALAKHPDWGTRALPLRAQLYVRQKDLEGVPPDRRPPFRTKFQLGAELLGWLKRWLGQRPGPLWLAVDGGYAKKPFLRPAREHGFVVVSRLRKDAALCTVPDGKRRPGQRGPLPTYGKGRISLAKRAGQTRGWQEVECLQYRERVTKTVKTFLATWKPAGGLIRVVLVREEDGWLPLFCTDPQASVADILEAAADRNALEETNKDVKEVWGAGQQQLRNVDANVGAFNRNGWLYTLVEAWAWHKPEAELVDRSDSPWDQEDRRPSHRDKRKALQREVLRREIQEALSGPLDRGRIQQLAEQLLSLAG